MRLILLAAALAVPMLAHAEEPAPPAPAKAPEPVQNVLPTGSIAVPLGLANVLLVHLDAVAGTTRSDVTASLFQQLNEAMKIKPQACPVPTQNAPASKP